LLIDSPNISRTIADRIRLMIARKELGPGLRINEVHLSRALGVSRTPLREALSALSSEGALSTVARKGFFVAPLSAEEVRDIYPIRAILDPEALRLSGIPGKAVLQRLERLNERILKARSIEARIALDDEWHLALVAGCLNRVILGLIEQFIRRTHRYEFAYMADRSNLEAAVDEHEQILEALRRKDLDAACVALKQNLTSGCEVILRWLETQRS